MTTTIHLPTLSSWRMKFMQIESKIFDIHPNDWRRKLGMKVKELGLNYQADVHDFHVSALNVGMNLNPQLRKGDFDGEMVLGDLRDNLVRHRVPPVLRSGVIVPMAEGQSISALGLTHLDSGVAK